MLIPKDDNNLTLPSLALSLSAGLAGFFPLHPMTVTEAERRRAQMEQTGEETGTEGSSEEERKESEV